MYIQNDAMTWKMMSWCSKWCHVGLIIIKLPCLGQDVMSLPEVINKLTLTNQQYNTKNLPFPSETWRRREDVYDLEEKKTVYLFLWVTHVCSL